MAPGKMWMLAVPVYADLAGGIAVAVVNTGAAMLALQVRRQATHAEELAAAKSLAW